MQPQFILTIQPAGTKFDPPARLSLPNVDGHLPGAQVEMYSFDHDLEEFVAIGLGTVSKDGTVIRSNEGVGVIKAGWHCGSQPDGGGCGHSCSFCEECTGECVCELQGDRVKQAEKQKPNDCQEALCGGGFNPVDDLEEEYKNCSKCEAGKRVSEEDGPKTPVPPVASIPRAVYDESIVDEFDEPVLGQTLLVKKSDFSMAACESRCVSGKEKWQVVGNGLRYDLSVKLRAVYPEKSFEVLDKNNEFFTITCPSISLYEEYPQLASKILPNENHHASAFSESVNKLNSIFSNGNSYATSSQCDEELSSVREGWEEEKEKYLKDQICHRDSFFQSHDGWGIVVKYNLNVDQENNIYECTATLSSDSSIYPDTSESNSVCP